MNNSEIINYASNKDAILKAKNNIKSNPQNSDLLNKQIESLENQNKDILDIASERKLEENILKTQKLSESSDIEESNCQKWGKNEDAQEEWNEKWGESHYPEKREKWCDKW